MRSFSGSDFVITGAKELIAIESSECQEGTVHVSLHCPGLGSCFSPRKALHRSGVADDWTSDLKQRIRRRVEVETGDTSTPGKFLKLKPKVSPLVRLGKYQNQGEKEKKSTI